MRYLMRQKIFSLADKFRIKDDAGRDVFVVNGKVFSLGDKLSFRDMEGRELAFIREKLISMTPTYEIHRDGRRVAVVRKKMFTPLRCRFTVDVPGPNDIEAAGSLLDHEYEFTRGGRTIARVSKKWFSVSDNYGVEIEPGEDDVLIMASTVVIDMACHGGRE